MWKRKHNSEDSTEILQQINSLNKTVQELKSPQVANIFLSKQELVDK